MAIFILKHTTNAAPVTATGQLEFNTDKKTLVVGDGTNEVVIAKMNVENQGSFLLTGDIRLSGSIYLGDVAADNIAALGTFTTNLVPNGTINIGTPSAKWDNVYANNLIGAVYATNGIISGSSQITGILPAGVVSGSSQIVLRNTDGFSSYDSAISIITGSLIESASTAKNTNDSQNVSITNLNSTTASLNVSITNLNTTTASLNSTTASLNTSVFNLNTTTASLNTSISNLNTTTASLNTSVSNINSTTESLNTSVSNINSTTASLNTSVSNLNLFTASLNTSVSNLNSFTSSQLTQNSNLATYTGSVEGRFSTLATYTGSNDTTNTNQNNRLTALEVASSSLNDYTASLKTALDVSGQNLTVYGNLTVQGTQTTLNTNEVIIEDKTLTLASGSTTAAEADGAGIQIAGANVTMSWDNTNNRVLLNTNLGIIGSISSSTIEGLGGASVLVYSTSVDSRLSNIQLFTQSVEGRLSTLATYTGSIEGRFSTLATYTGSVDGRFVTLSEVTSSLHTFTASANTAISNLNTTTASLNTSVSNINQFTASTLTRLSNLETTSASVNTSVSNLNTFSGSQLDKDAVLATLTASYDGRFTTLSTLTASYDGRFTTLGSYTGSVEGRFSTLSTLTSSYDGRFVEVGVVTGSLIASASTAKNTNDAQDISITNLNLFSASVSSSLGSIYQTTQSLNEFSASVSSSLGSIYQTTSSLNAYTASALVSMSVIFTSASALDGRLDYLEGVAFGGLDISGQFTAIGIVTGSLISSASLVSQSVWHLHQFSSSVTSSLVSLYQTTASLNSFTESIDQRLDSIESVSGSWITEAESGSFLITASYAGSTLTFTKGNNQSFNIEISTGSAVSASIAQQALDVVVNVKNMTGGQLNKGTVVRIIGSQVSSDVALIGTASWENDGSSANTLGFLMETLPHDSFGRVITQGVLTGINTDGFTGGQMLYLSSSGQYTNVKPPAPYHEVRIGQVLRTHQNQGSVFISVMNGYELEELHDVDINTGSLVNNNLVAWNSNITQWVNRTVTEVGATTTSSFQTYTASADTRLLNLEQYSGSLKTAIGLSGANVTILGDLTVNGTTTTVNSTTIQLGDNIIELNGTGAANGGLRVKDPTAPNTVSGSLLWDSTNDYWIAGALGAESKLLRAGGDSVISASAQVNIYDLENFSTFNDAIQNDISGKEEVASATHTLVSGSSQISYTNLSNIPAGIISGAAQITTEFDTRYLNTGGDNVISASSLINLSSSIIPSITNEFDLGSATKIWRDLYISTGSIKFVDGTTVVKELKLSTITGLESATGSNNTSLTNLNSFTSSINTTIKSKLDADGVISSSAQLTTTFDSRYLNTGGDGVVSGSSQITYSNLTGIPSGIVSGAAQVTPLLPAGTVSGSSQVSYTGLSNIPAGIVSGAAQITPLLPAGVVSGSAQLTTEFDTRYLNTGGDSVFSSSVQIGNYVATITGTSNQVVVAGSGNNAAAITLSTPQNIHTAATPQFASLGIGTAASGVTGEIRATADIVAFYSSDERLKENIQPIQNALTKVEAISGNTYDWKEGFETIHSHKGNDIGVIAQEVEKILPQAVIDRDNGYKAVDYEKIVPLLIEAIKELSAKVKELEKK